MKPWPENYRSIYNTIACYFNPNNGNRWEDDRRRLLEQMSVQVYAERLRQQFEAAYHDEEFSWLEVFRHFDIVYGKPFETESEARDWVSKYVWPALFPDEPPRI